MCHVYIGKKKILRQIYYEVSKNDIDTVKAADVTVIIRNNNKNTNKNYKIPLPTSDCCPKCLVLIQITDKGYIQ